MTPTAFFSKYAPYAELTQILHGVPASVTLAQAALESAWGESGLTKNANNFFGIKADSSWIGPSYAAGTYEYINGVKTWVPGSKFRKYITAQGSFDDHAKFLKKFNRYAGLFKLPVSDVAGWATGLQSAGYATDPAYASKLIKIINQHGLAKYDQAAAEKKKLE